MIPSIPALVVGRILLGGLSTSLSFSAFESWMMVSEHRKNGYDGRLLSSTYAISSSDSYISDF
jgi:hypothetical protein